MLYSGQTNGFYLRDIHGADIPADAVDISDEHYEGLLAGQAKGMVIGADSHGFPILIPRAPAPPLAQVLTRAQFCVALTKTTPPIFTATEALAALEAFPPQFTAALVGKPLEYQAAAIEAWRETKTVSRDAPLFLDLLAFYAAQAKLTSAQAAALGDMIFGLASPIISPNPQKGQ